MDPIPKKQKLDACQHPQEIQDCKEEMVSFKKHQRTIKHLLKIYDVERQALEHFFKEFGKKVDIDWPK